MEVGAGVQEGSGDPGKSAAGSHVEGRGVRDALRHGHGNGEQSILIVGDRRFVAQRIALR